MGCIRFDGNSRNGFDVECVGGGCRAVGLLGRIKLLLLFIGEHSFDVIKWFSFGFGQTEIDEDKSHDAPRHVKPEGSVFAQCLVHIAEAANDGERAQQVEARRKRSQNAPTFARFRMDNKELKQHVTVIPLPQ